MVSLDSGEDRQLLIQFSSKQEPVRAAKTIEPIEETPEIAEEDDNVFMSPSPEQPMPPAMPSKLTSPVKVSGPQTNLTTNPTKNPAAELKHFTFDLKEDMEYKPPKKVANKGGEPEMQGKLVFCITLA